MRKQVIVGIINIVGAPVLLLASYWLRVVSDLSYAGQEIVIVIVTVMFCTGVSLIWNGRKPDEQDNLRKQRIHAAIKKWVELPIVKFRDKQDMLPLAEKPPELAVEIEQCLSRKYQSTIYASLQKLRQEYHEWKDTASSVRFTKVENGKTIIDYRCVLAYNESTCRELVQLHDQLGKQIKSEILDKDHTRLKC